MQYLWIFLTVFLAFTKGRSIVLWAAGAYFFGWVAWLVIMFLPVRTAVLTERLTKINLLAGRMLDQKQSAIVKKEMKDFNTVEDLFKQLETK